jgi:hypothetical protein
MTRQEQISLLGKKAKIGEYEYNNKKHKNFLSYFIIPVPHKFNEKRKNLEDVEKCGWKILNLKSDGINKKRIFDFNSDLKKYIYEGLMPQKTKKDFINEKSNIVLQKKISEDFKIRTQSNDVFMRLEEVDLWILEGNIAFFVLKFQLSDKYNLETNTVNLNELSNVNRILRDFRNVFIFENGNEIIHVNNLDYIKIVKWEKNKNALVKERKTVDVNAIKSLNYFKFHKKVQNKIYYFKKPEEKLIDYLFRITQYDKKSFLNITEQDLDKEQFYPIYNSSYYAKLLTAAHVEIDYEILSLIESPTTGELKRIEIDGTDTIEEMPFLLASTSDFYPSESWESNENYINEMVNKGGINIWKYWSGIALKDSLAFFSVNDGGGMIVSACKDINYFIYILNLYVNYRVKLLEHNLILDRYFIDIEKNLKNLEEVQRLHNMYMSEEIAIRFQPNEIHQAIMRGLELKELFNEVEENIKNTYERAKDNTGIIISIFSGVIALIGFFLTKDKIKSYIYQFYEYSPFLSILSLVLIIMFIGLGIFYRRKIYKFLALLKRKVLRNVL